MLDVKDLLDKILAALKGVITEYIPNIKDTAIQYEQATVERVKLLVQLKAEGEISNSFFLDRLKDELTILLSELDSYLVIGKKGAEEAVNAAIDIATGAIKDIAEKDVPPTAPNTTPPPPADGQTGHPPPQIGRAHV